jgi:DNA polymerase-3 subunit alpha
VSERSFTHLHTHTEFSMLDGAARVGDLVAAAVADGQPALGITDHGNMYGVLDFYKACRAQGITPIIGTEAYMAGESRHERPVRRGKVDDTGGDVDGGQKLYYHLTLLSETVEGYRNLLKLSSAAYLEGYYYKPRLDWELLERHHTGLIATTGCLGGVVPQRPATGHQRQPLHAPRGRRGPRRPALRPDRGPAGRDQPVQVRGHRALPQVGPGDAPSVL